MSGNAVVALAVVALAIAIPAIVAMYLYARRHGCCCGCSTMCHGCHVHGSSHHTHTHRPRGPLTIMFNVDELRALLRRILDMDAYDGRLNRHRRAINALRTDHDDLADKHDTVAELLSEHLASPHDTHAIEDMIAAERDRSVRAMADHKDATDRTIAELREQIAKMSGHHHTLTLRDIILSTSKRLRALVLAVIVFAVVLLVDFYMPGIQGLFTKTLNLVYNHHSYPIYGLVWDWPRIGVAFALALVTYTIVNILSATDNTARTVEHDRTSGPVY